VSYRVKTTPTFDRKAKKLAKKYRSLREDLAELSAVLKQNPNQGTPIGHNCYKVRLAIKAKGRGKSFGARVITFVYVEGEIVNLLSIYDKSDQSSISESELRDLLAEIE